MFGFAGRVQTFSKAATALLAAALLTLAAQPANAQQKPRRRETNANRQARIARLTEETYAHRYEIFGGGGFLRYRTGPDLQKINEVTWATSGTYFLNPKIGVTADVRGAFGNAKLGNNIYTIYGPIVNEYSFMGGATYRFYSKEKIDVSGYALGGYAIGNFNGDTKRIDSPLLGMWPSENRPVFSFGANLDYNFYPNIAFRAGPTYVGYTFGGTVQNSLGFNAGIVYRFGHLQ
jgi:hypothetical protein